MAAAGNGPKPKRPRMGRPVGSDSTKTRERILQDAQAVFVEMGYSKASHDVIAARAGVSRTLLYRYYESKNALYGALLERIHERLVGQAADLELGGPRSLASLLSAAVQLHSRDTDYSRILATSLVDGLREPEFASVADSSVKATRQLFEAAVSQAAAAGQLHPDDDPEAVVDLLFASLWGLGLFAAFMGSEEQVERAMDLLTRRVLPALFIDMDS